MRSLIIQKSITVDGGDKEILRFIDWCSLALAFIVQHVAGHKTL